MEKVELTVKELDVLIEAVTMWEHVKPNAEDVAGCIQAIVINSQTMSQDVINQKIKEVQDKLLAEHRKRLEFGIMLKSKILKLKDKTCVSDLIQ